MALALFLASVGVDIKGSGAPALLRLFPLQVASAEGLLKDLFLAPPLGPAAGEFLRHPLHGVGVPLMSGKDGDRESGQLSEKALDLGKGQELDWNLVLPSSESLE